MFKKLQELLFGTFSPLARTTSLKNPVTLAESYKQQGNQFFAEGNLDHAEKCFRQAISAAPHYAEGHNNLGFVLKEKKCFDEAVQCLKTAITLNDQLTNAYFNLGIIHEDQDLISEAIEYFEKVISIDPEFTPALVHLGLLYSRTDHIDEAIRYCQLVLELAPNIADSYVNLGIVLKNQGNFAEIVACFRQAVRLNPEHGLGWKMLGITLSSMNCGTEAIDSLQKATNLLPKDEEIYFYLGGEFIKKNLFNHAISNFHKALDINPNRAESHLNLGNALKDLGQLDEAMASYRKALEIKPDFAEAYHNLASALLSMWKLEDAAACYRQALKIKPDYADTHTGLIFALDMTIGLDIPTLQSERKKWGEAHAARCSQHHHHSNSPIPERPLRIGYISADFRMHSAAYVFGAMLVKFDSSQFSVYAYSNTQKEDDFTKILRQNVAAWRNIVNLTDDEVAKLIRNDEIDILVDLSGHSAGNRLLVFARKPAPIQITAWGYIGGTGLKTMDVFFADPIVVPPEETQYYAENVRYLPCVVGAYFPHTFPDVNPLPALTNRYITFGSFNRLVKISDAAYHTWAAVLKTIPNSRMVLKTAELDDPPTRTRVLEQLTRHGISAERISLLGKTPRFEHLQAYNQIDIALDPYPHGGGVTALEGLMMGVPVLAMRWDGTIHGRVSSSIMTTLELDNWVATTEHEYIEIAREQSSDLSRLNNLRQQLRHRFSSSIIGNAENYTRAVEKEYRSLWQNWCAQH